MSQIRNRRVLKWFAAVIFLFLIAEMAVRLSRATDVTLYLADAGQGYIPQPNQSGAFLWTRKWAFNEHSMGIDRPFAPTTRPDILLIGDSIVMGGNPFRAEERLGPQLAARLPGTAVWPISAGSWGLQNELWYLQTHPEIVRGIDHFVFVLNSEDFDLPSSWASEATHPTYRPWLRSVYLLQRYWLKPTEQTPPNLHVPPRDLRTMFNRFASATNRPITVFLYPTKEETQQARPCGFAPRWLTDAPRLRWFCVAADPAWTPALYADVIHPIPKGVVRLSTIIARQLPSIRSDQ